MIFVQVNSIKSLSVIPNEWCLLDSFPFQFSSLSFFIIIIFLCIFSWEIVWNFIYIYIYIKRERWPKCKTQKKNVAKLKLKKNLMIHFFSLFVHFNPFNFFPFYYNPKVILIVFNVWVWEIKEKLTIKQ
jgi:hypothetical protein